jgi:transposase
VWDQATVSLARVVGAMAALDLPPEAVRPPPRPRVPASQVSCLNRVCPLFQMVGAGNVHPFRWTPNDEIYCCLECGSHFSQTRLVSSFDEDCSPRGASPRRSEVLEEQKRVAAWHAPLEAACIQLLAEDSPISVTAAFRQAGLPRTPRLRAPRLGLVTTVERYVTLQAQGVRERILEGFRAGMPPRELAQVHGVSITLVRQVLAHRPKVHGTRPRCIRAEQEGELWAQLEASPTATDKKLAQRWNQAHGTAMHRSTMRDAIYRLGWTRVQGRWEPPSTRTAT